ncbi:MAG: TIGR02147 family protein [Fibrobacteria bacterium]
MPDVFTYTAYREFLRDYYREKKAGSKSFSFQNFARKAGIASSGFLLHVIKGERNLTRPVLLKVAAAMGLDREQTGYFEILVGFDQAKTPVEKDFYYSKLRTARQSAQVKTLEDDQYAFFSDWYHSVIRELAPLLPAGSAPSAIAKLVAPGITANQAKASLRLQEGLGILSRDAGGAYAPRDAFIGASGAPARKVAITKFQQAMLALAGQAWDHFPENDIAMRTSTISLSEEAAQAVKAELKACNQRILDLTRADKLPATRVYHINLNFFPVTRKIKELGT